MSRKADSRIVAIGGIVSLNGQTGATQTFAVSTNGSDFTISSSGNVHTFNLPFASDSSHGKLSQSDWISFTNKLSGGPFTAGSVIFSNGTDLTQDNANLFWDDTNNRLGVGTTSPTAHVHVQTSFTFTTGSQSGPQEFGAGNFFNGDTVNYRLYGTKVVGGVTYYTSTYSESGTLTITSDGVGVFLNWEPGSGVDGYRLLRDYNSAGFVEFYDVGGGTAYDTNSGEFQSGSTVTPNDPTQYVYLDYNDGSTYWGLYTNENARIGGYLITGGAAGIGVTPTVKFQVLSGTAGTMAFPFEVGVVERDADTKFGVYSSSSSFGDGAAITLGYTRALNTATRRPGFEFQCIGGATSADCYVRYNYLERDSAGSVAAATANILAVIGNGKVGIGTVTPAALLQIKAGTTAAGTAPLKLTSGSLMTSAEAGAIEFLTDKYYGSITTGTARKELTLNDAALTSGRVPFATTNGRLTDDSDMTFATDTLTVTGLVVGTTKISSYNGVSTQGLGVPAIYKVGRATGQTSANASVVTFTPTADGTFLISANVLVTTATVHSFTVTCAYTDEGNTARTLTLTFSNVGGTLLTAIANAGGTVPYEGIPLHIRVKANTAITLATAGTFTTVTYNVEGVIQRLA